MSPPVVKNGSAKRGIEIKKIAKFLKDKETKTSKRDTALAIASKAPTFNVESVTPGGSTPPQVSQAEREFLIVKILKTKQIPHSLKARLICHLK